MTIEEALVKLYVAIVGEAPSNSNSITKIIAELAESWPSA